MYFIQCRFKKTKDGDSLHGYAVCSDPDTPITFILPNGEAYNGGIWTYQLLHHMPWVRLKGE